jgi:hypothetical protein
LLKNKVIKNTMNANRIPNGQGDDPLGHNGVHNQRDPNRVLQALARAKDGAGQAGKYVRSLFTGQNSDERGELAAKLASSKKRLEFLAQEIPKMEVALAQGLPYPPSEIEPQFPAGFRTRAGLVVLGGGLVFLEAATCSNIMTWSLPLTQSYVSAFAMAAPFFGLPFAIKFVSGQKSLLRAVLAFVYLAAVCVYAAIFAHLVGIPGGDDASLNLGPVLGSQLVAEAFAITIVAGCIVRLLQPAASAQLVQLLDDARCEMAELEGDMARAEAGLTGLKSQEDAVEIEAQAIVSVMQAASEAEEARIRSLHKSAEDLSARLWSTAAAILLMFSLAFSASAETKVLIVDKATSSATEVTSAIDKLKGMACSLNTPAGTRFIVATLEGEHCETLVDATVPVLQNDSERGRLYKIAWKFADGKKGFGNAAQPKDSGVTLPVVLGYLKDLGPVNNVSVWIDASPVAKSASGKLDFAVEYPSDGMIVSSPDASRLGMSNLRGAFNGVGISWLIPSDIGLPEENQHTLFRYESVSAAYAGAALSTWTPDQTTAWNSFVRSEKSAKEVFSLSDEPAALKKYGQVAPAHAAQITPEPIPASKPASATPAITPPAQVVQQAKPVNSTRVEKAVPKTHSAVASNSDHVEKPAVVALSVPPAIVPEPPVHLAPVVSTRVEVAPIPLSIESPKAMPKPNVPHETVPTELNRKANGLAVIWHSTDNVVEVTLRMKPGVTAKDFGELYFRRPDNTVKRYLHDYHPGVADYAWLESATSAELENLVTNYQIWIENFSGPGSVAITAAVADHGEIIASKDFMLPGSGDHRHDSNNREHSLSWVLVPFDEMLNRAQ